MCIPGYRDSKIEQSGIQIASAATDVISNGQNNLKMVMQHWNKLFFIPASNTKYQNMCHLSVILCISATGHFKGERYFQKYRTEFLGSLFGRISRQYLYFQQNGVTVHRNKWSYLMATQITRITRILSAS